MPVFGYLAIPVNGATNTLHHELCSLPFCEVVPANNRDILVLVTDTPDEETEKHLRKTLDSLSSLESLSMTFGHYDEQQPENEVR